MQCDKGYGAVFDGRHFRGSNGVLSRMGRHSHAMGERPDCLEFHKYLKSTKTGSDTETDEAELAFCLGLFFS